MAAVAQGLRFPQRKQRQHLRGVPVQGQDLGG